MASSAEAIVDVATHAGLPEAIVGQAHELAAVEEQFGDDRDGE